VNRHCECKDPILVRMPFSLGWASLFLPASRCPWRGRVFRLNSCSRIAVKAMPSGRANKFIGQEFSILSDCSVLCFLPPITTPQTSRRSGLHCAELSISTGVTSQFSKRLLACLSQLAWFGMRKCLTCNAGVSKVCNTTHLQRAVDLMLSCILLSRGRTQASTQFFIVSLGFGMNVNSYKLLSESAPVNIVHSLLCFLPGLI